VQVFETHHLRTGFALGGEKDEIHPAQRDDCGKMAFAFEFSDGT
jgi:hypothetical protein